jgi:hypothetical protein
LLPLGVAVRRTFPGRIGHNATDNRTDRGGQRDHVADPVDDVEECSYRLGVGLGELGSAFRFVRLDACEIRRVVGAALT